ncbi:MAG: DUF2480 family protein [Bacteroidia bacterium]
MEEIINKVAQSGIVTIDLEEFYDDVPRVLFDIKPLLFQELILKEKDFREYIKKHSWGQYKNTYVALTCTADAIVPTWAYMLLTLSLQPFAKKIVYGNIEVLDTVLLQEKINALNIYNYKDARIVIKGCGNKPVPIAAYVALTEKIKPVAKSIMYGEPCSTVPLYKKPTPKE